MCIICVDNIYIYIYVIVRSHLAQVFTRARCSNPWIAIAMVGDADGDDDGDDDCDMICNWFVI